MVTVSFSGSFGSTMCVFFTGILTTPLTDTDPARMNLISDTWLTRSGKRKPVLIVATDYDDYAAIYICRLVLDVGTCDLSQAFMVFLSRHFSGLTPRLKSRANDASLSACLWPTLLYMPLIQTGGRDFRPDKFLKSMLGARFASPHSRTNFSLD